MHQLSHWLFYLLYPFYMVTVPDSQYYLPSYFAAGVTAVIIRFAVKRRWHMSASALKRYLLPLELWKHPSNWLDVKLYFISLYYVLLQATLIGGTTFLSVEGTVNLLSAAISPAHGSASPSWPITLVTMCLVFMAVEFGYWVAHYMMHKIPALWEFHKVHHSAEVLTPLTEWRQHPVELALFPILMTGAACLVQGPMIWAFGAGAQTIDPVKANLISMAFWFTILHLRHTHIPLYATGLLGKIIQAPAHHQVHHSTNPKHYDTNLGYCLSLFDWIFGTLYVPHKGEKFEYGLGHQDHALETALGSIFAPFGRAAMIVFRTLGLGARLGRTSSARE